MELIPFLGSINIKKYGLRQRQILFLYFTTRNLVEYFVGSEERFELSLEIQNAGEDAYEATLYLDLPESLSYIKTEVVEGYGEATVPVLCSPPTHNNNFVLKCDLGNPMAAASKVNLVIISVTLGTPWRRPAR